MFGLGEGKEKAKGNDPIFVYDLERDLKDPSKRKEIKEKAEYKIKKIKEILRTGESQDVFDSFGLLLQGYNSLLKVIERVSSK